MAQMGKSPLALLLNDANPVMAQGAAFAELPFMDRFEVDITTTIKTGDRIMVEPARGLVRILSSD
jgi:predicted aconitase with swiveling domain